MRDPFRFRHLAVAAVAATLALAATPGRADVVPEERVREKPCTAPGQPCRAEGSLEDQSGTCVAATCTREVQKHTREGGTALVKVPCFHCVAIAPGSPQPKAKSSGCAVAPERCDRGSLAVIVLLIAGLMSSRKPKED